MKTTGIIAAFIAAAAAAPAHKRDIVWVVETAEVVETVYQTTTVWVDSLPESTAVAVAAASATTPAGGEFYNQYGHRSSQAAAVSSTSSSPAAVSTSSSVFVPAPAPSTLATSISSSVAPVVPAYTAPAVSTTQAAPTTTTPAPVVVPTTSTYVAPAPVTTSTTSAAPAQSTSSSSAPTGTTYTGDITHYTPGMGSCGETSGEADLIVAIPHGMMNNGINPNNNPLCGKMITVSGPGKTVSNIKVVDTCGGCDGASIDVPEALFNTITNFGDGRVHNIDWWFQ